MNAIRITDTTLLAGARALLPELASRSQEIDNLRHLPQDLAQRMAGFGLLPFGRPGGSGWTGHQSHQIL
jgi:hypothetical protein